MLKSRVAMASYLDFLGLVEAPWAASFAESWEDDLLISEESDERGNR